MANYPLTLTPDSNDTLLVTSPKLPEVTSFGATREEAIRNGAAAVMEALAARISAGEAIPAPRTLRRADAAVATIDLWTEAKVGLHRALLDRKITRAELSRRLGWHREQVDRLFRLDHASRPDQMEAAFAALGYGTRFRIVPIAPEEPARAI